jgi:hypothetical protein
MSPFKSDDLTEIVVACGDKFAVLQSPETAEHSPDYRKVAEFANRQDAEAYLAGILQP